MLLRTPFVSGEEWVEGEPLPEWQIHTTGRPEGIFKNSCYPMAQKLHRIRKKTIRQCYGVAPTTENLRKVYLCCHSHVLHSDITLLAYIGQNLEITGAHPKARLKQRWTNMLHTDLTVAQYHPDQVHDQIKWCLRSRGADPATVQNWDQRTKMKLRNENATSHQLYYSILLNTSHKDG